MLLNDILKPLNEIAPLIYAEPWDNVGLLVGDPQQTIKKILLTIDYTQAVAAESRNLNCDLIISYHPPIFSAVKRITADGPSGLIHDAVRHGIAIYSPHTAWDSADGGTNDFLAESLGLLDTQPLRFNSPDANTLKLVTFVPESHIDIVSDAIFKAGAGHIGKYHSCSFRSTGTGTFFGGPGAQPTVGKAGQLEKQPETKLETIIPAARVSQVVRALLSSHPYEEPAYDLTMLTAPPTGHGQGRVGHFASPVWLPDLIDRLKSSLKLDSILLAGEVNRQINKVAICAGAGGDLLDTAIACKADLYLTGELRHHDALKIVAAGMSAICTLHSNCERPSLKRLKSRLEELVANCPPVILSQADRDPFAVS